MKRTEDDILQAVYRVIRERQANPSESSYTATLLTKGVDKVLKKVGEEAAELLIAGKGGVRDEIVYETADLFFHSLILLAFHEIPLDAVYDELSRRFGVSGLAEKASRQEG